MKNNQNKKLEHKINYPGSPGCFSHPITKTWDIEYTPKELTEQMVAIIRYPQKTNNYNYR